MISLISSVPVNLQRIEADDTRGRRRKAISRTVLHELQIVGVRGDRSSIVAGITGQAGAGRHAKLQDSGLTAVVAALRRCLRGKRGRETALVAAP
jgi:hypothetical protein